MDHPSPQLITQLYLDNKNHSIYDLLAENSNKEKETSDSIKSIAHPIDQPRSNTLDQYTHLQLLSLANCSLTTLKYFPDLTNLKKV